jgi:hypothetical protein
VVNYFISVTATQEAVNPKTKIAFFVSDKFYLSDGVSPNEISSLVRHQPLGKCFIA